MGRNVVLTGFMGTGKTTVGRLLADRLGYGFVDTDAVIESRFGPIPEIFAEHGEAVFRRHERDVALELSERRDLVISTGGRLLLDPPNADALGATGDVVCLTATVATIVARVTADGAADRPLLADPDPGLDLAGRIATLLDERAPGYAAFAQVPTDHGSPADVADAVLAAVGRG